MSTSATPEGKPSARESVHEAFRLTAQGSTAYIVPMCWTRQRQCGPLCDALTAAAEARDALHAETLRREVQAQATSDAGSFAAERAELQRLVADARAALQRGEERERVMREALERIAEYEIDWREGPGYNVGVLQQRDEDALAAVQAMKEGT